MMIFMAIMSQTGVFQWLAFHTFRLARGHAFVVTAVLVGITGVISSVLNDTTVMLLMAPVSIQIALTLGIHPAAIVVPEVLASNIGGAATLIGTPPNTIIGSYVGLSFNQFLVNMLPIAVHGHGHPAGDDPLAVPEEFGRRPSHPPQALVRQLEAGARITDPVLLRKSLIALWHHAGPLFYRGPVPHAAGRGRHPGLHRAAALGAARRQRHAARGGLDHAGLFHDACS